MFLAGNSILGEIGLAFLAVKLLLSASPRRKFPEAEDEPVSGLRVVVLVPMYNEDPEIIRRSIRSMLNQTRMPDRIHVIDDGSRSTEAVEAVKLERRGAGDSSANFAVTARTSGSAKRLPPGVRAEPDADIFVTVDSDTVLDPHAVEALLRVFRDRTVFGATWARAGVERQPQHPHEAH